MARRKKTPLSALAVRMKEDLVLSGKATKTVKVYLAAVRQLARYYNLSPAQLSEDQVRKYLVFLTEKKSGGRDVAAHRRRSKVLLFGDVPSGVEIDPQCASAEDSHAANYSIP